MRWFRVRLASLLWLVAIAAVFLAALRSGSHTWAGVACLVACGLLALGVVGVARTGGAERTWWLGFAVFGWGYMYLAFWSAAYFAENELPTVPTEAMLEALRPYIGPPAPWLPGAHGLPDNPYWQVGHCLCGLLAALLGGALASAVFAARSNPSDRPSVDRQESGAALGRRWRRPEVIGLAVSVLFTSVALAGSRKAPGLWAGGTVLLTWGVLGLTSVAAARGREGRRTACLGAALFGVGFMILVCPPPPDHRRGYPPVVSDWPRFTTNRLLNALRPWLPSVAGEFPAASDGIASANARVLKALDQSITLRFPQETPLVDVLKFIVTTTRAPDGRELPIYVDLHALRDAEETMQSPVKIVLDGVPLRTALRLSVEQLGLSCSVKDGVVLIDSDFDRDWPIYEDPFLVIGRCFLALVAAALGSLLATLVHDRTSEP